MAYIHQIHGPSSEHPEGWHEPLTDDEYSQRKTDLGSKGGMFAFAERPMDPAQRAAHRKNFEEQTAAHDAYMAAHAAPQKESLGSRIAGYFHDRRAEGRRSTPT